jgi:hypothetical protein
MPAPGVLCERAGWQHPHRPDRRYWTPPRSTRLAWDKRALTAGTATDQQGMITTRSARGACIASGANRKKHREGDNHDGWS